jgi:hypothetical protein
MIYISPSTEHHATIPSRFAHPISAGQSAVEYGRSLRDHTNPHLGKLLNSQQIYDLLYFLTAPFKCQTHTSYMTNLIDGHFVTNSTFC